MRSNKINSDIDTFNIKFENVDGEEVGKLIIERGKSMKFEGDMDESADLFFQHVKDRIDAYLKSQYDYFSSMTSDGENE